MYQLNMNKENLSAFPFFGKRRFRPLKAKLLDSERAVLALGQNQTYPSHYWVQTAGLGSSNRASTYKFANIPTHLPI